MKKAKSKYFTFAELSKAALQRAKEDPLWTELTDSDGSCPLDYAMSRTDSKSEQHIKTCDFDALGCAYFGGCEGIYARVFMHPVPDGSERILVTLKTLYEDKDAFMVMQRLAGLVAYYVREIVNENLDRFD